MPGKRNRAAKLNSSAQPTPPPQTAPAVLIPVEPVEEPSAGVVASVLLSSMVKKRYKLTTKIDDVIQDLKNLTGDSFNARLDVRVDLGDSVTLEPVRMEGAMMLGALVQPSPPESDHVSATVTFLPETESILKPLEATIDTFQILRAAHYTKQTNTIRELQATERALASTNSDLVSTASELVDAKNKLSVAQTEAFDQKFAIDEATAKLTSLSSKMLPSGKKKVKAKPATSSLNNAIDTLVDRFFAKLEAVDASVSAIKVENAALKEEHATLKEENAELRKELTEGRTEIRELREMVAGQGARIVDQRATIAEQGARIAELEDERTNNRISTRKLELTNTNMASTIKDMQQEMASGREDSWKLTVEVRELRGQVLDWEGKVNSVHAEFIYPIRRRKLLQLARDDFYERVNDHDVWEQHFAAQTLATLVATKLKDRPRLPPLATLYWLFDAKNKVRTEGNDAAHDGEEDAIAGAILEMPASEEDREHMEKVFMYQFDVDTVGLKET